MKRLPLVRRSTLIMPVNRPDFVEKSWRRGADAILLDLEDSIIDSQKAEARKFVKDAIPIACKGGADVLVRINSSPKDLAQDLEASIYPGIHGIVVPKVESAKQVQEIEEMIIAIEKSRGFKPESIKIGILIETAKGFLNLNEITVSSQRVESINLGTEDFILDLEIELKDGTELLYPKLQTIIAARAAGIQPLGLLGSISNFKDLHGLSLNARESYRYGYKGASCIHPAQVSILNEAFSPSSEEVEYAKKVIAIFEESAQKGHGSTSLDGKMIDIPIAIRANKVIERQKAIEQLNERKRAAIQE